MRLNNNEEIKKKLAIVNEGEIFKSLGHKIRRDIIKLLGENPSTFTEIKNNITDVDSPTLSYHLKSLELLLMQKENKYELSVIGEAAFNLLSKTDESVRISRYKRKFMYAYIATVFCWISASFIIPFIIAAKFDLVVTSISVNLIITAISTINEVIIGILRKKY